MVQVCEEPQHESFTFTAYNTTAFDTFKYSLMGRPERTDFIKKSRAEEVNHYFVQTENYDVLLRSIALKRLQA